MPKATYMYWQKRFDRVNPDKEIEEKILEVRKYNKDYGYRRIYGALRNLGYIINKKKVQRIIQKLGLQVTSFTRKSRKNRSTTCSLYRFIWRLAPSLVFKFQSN